MTAIPPVRPDGGSAQAPRLRFDLNTATLLDLPGWSGAPAGDWAAVYRGVRDAGYEGVQHPAPIRRAAAAGLRLTGAARADDPGELDAIAARHRAWGMDATTLHCGTGLESDAELDAYAAAILEAAARHRHPMLLELHRATITQDARRTLDLTERFAELRFNADLSHWYTGHEMTYGDFAAKLDRLEPVLSRVRFVHGRVGDSCVMQRGAGTPDAEPPYVAHFRTMWTRCFEGFLRDAEAGDVMVFAPELLPARTTVDGVVRRLDYALLLPDGSEETDRWTEALRLCAVADQCFTAARRATTPPADALEPDLSERPA